MGGDRLAVLDAGQDGRHRALDEVEEEAGEEAEDDDQRRQRREGQDLDRPHVGQVVAEAAQEVRQVAERKTRWNM